MTPATRFSGDQIYLIINIPAEPAFELWYPKANFVGSAILKRFIDCKLSQAGQLLEQCPDSGALNSSVMIFGVKGYREAFPIIKELLEEIALTGFAHIFRWDKDENILRIMAGDHNQKITIEDLISKYAANRKEWQAMMSRFTKLIT